MTNKRKFGGLALLLAYTLASGLACAQMVNQTSDGKLKPWSPEKTLKSIEVPKGYKLQLVASEPMVQEPVSFTFDPDGAMYVCEWNTYMQDQYASGQDEPKSRIVKLVDIDGDGKMDKRTVFADGLLLPRSILALHDRLLVRFTHDSTIWSYFDDNGDGISDRREVAHKGRGVRGNIEHQDNSLLWNVDNKIYATGQVYSYQKGKLIAQKSYGRYGQWGLTRDDVGRIYGSFNSDVVKNSLNLGGYPLIYRTKVKNLNQSNSICKVDDATATRRGTHITAAGGQAMIRSAQLSAFKGQLVIPDSVRRLVKMVSFSEKNGISSAASSALFKGTEFIRSADAYFRPVWTAMGPDGALYIADMSRGNVQESNWFHTERTKNPNKAWLARYYRMKDWGMLTVKNRGRIYRLVPEDTSLLDKPKKLSKVSSAKLVGLLGHANGWWRDTAQMLIVCRDDRSVIPRLKKALRSSKPLARLNALRILKTFDALQTKYIMAALKDKDERVRVHGICLSEQFLEKSAKIFKAVSALLSDKSLMVKVQLYSSLTRSGSQKSISLRKLLVSKYPKHKMLESLETNKNALSRTFKKYRPGHKIYQSFCINCHGEGDKGITKMGRLMAPIFTDNERVKNQDYMTKVILKGIHGPLGAKKETFSEGMMPPLGAVYDDQQIADVI
ncbi:MAG: c-type cytochrome, partial [Lentisphaeraceae bacterium]|nr:c-type cytochrome [Lentisphaeraceae bacterium]